MIDTRQEMETPEGVELSLSPAGPVARAMAWSTDAVIRVAVYTGIATLVGLLGELGEGLFLIVFFALEWLYPVFFEARRGCTPGQRSFGLAVVHTDGSPVSLGNSLLRNLLRTADFMPFGYLFGLISVLTTRRFQRLGDLAAGTLVVHTARAKLPLVVAPEAPPLAVPVSLSADEQRALVSFAERAPGWGPARAAEVAELNASWLGHTGGDRVRQVYGMARWIAGER